jgi:hypothetical protein
MNTFLDFVRRLSEADLKQLGAALHKEPLERLHSFYEGAQASRDGSEILDGLTDHYFSLFADALGEKVRAQAHSGATLLGSVSLTEMSRQVQMQLQAEYNTNRQME